MNKYSFELTVEELTQLEFALLERKHDPSTTMRIAIDHNWAADQVDFIKKSQSIIAGLRKKLSLSKIRTAKS